MGLVGDPDFPPDWAHHIGTHKEDLATMALRWDWTSVGVGLRWFF
jgi:hypothetical protein